MEIKLLSGRCGGMECIGDFGTAVVGSASRWYSRNPSPALVHVERALCHAIMKQFSVFRFYDSRWPLQANEERL